MDAWWSSLSGAQQTLWGIGIFSSVMLVLQMGLSLIGIDHHGGDVGQDHSAASTDHDHTPVLRFFTIRTALAFGTGLGWGGLMLISWGIPQWLAIFLAVGTGLGFAVSVMGLMGLFASLATSGSVDLDQAVNNQGEVTLAIPGYGSGYGKMLLSIQGRSLEIEAYTRGADIRRGTRVRVVRREGSGMLFVEPMVS
jgi:hypothetical protein